MRINSEEYKSLKEIYSRALECNKKLDLKLNRLINELCELLNYELNRKKYEVPQYRESGLIYMENSNIYHQRTETKDEFIERFLLEKDNNNSLIELAKKVKKGNELLNKNEKAINYP